MSSDPRFSDNNYQTQLDRKSQVFRQKLADANLPVPTIDVYPSAPTGFRMRAEFRIWHEQGKAHYAMNHPGEKKPYIIEDFPIGSILINTLMPPILSAINGNPVLSKKLFSIEFLTTTRDEALITLIYHRPLDQDWQRAAEQLQADLNIHIIGRSRKQKLVLNRDYVIECLSIQGRDYLYQQIESGFTQPNAEVNCKMLSWASDCLRDSRGDLIELYCGNGNFTAVLAQHFDRVLATEIAKISVNSALENFKSNQIDNVTVARLSSEELTQALNREREFRRLAEVDLDSYNFSTIFVDPPRAGLDAGTEKLVTEFDNILYISCNPDSLIQNLKSITQTHKIQKIALFDQFPWTEHVESGVFLKRHI
jgi:tRNA (uracil-5-)-methyltransferase